MVSQVKTLLLFVLLVLTACTNENPSSTGNNSASSNSSANSSKPPGTREPVLVELFTSEGCGNCPPADRQLAFLETQQPVAGADVITLGYHVDYFDDRGWKDPYSSPDHTRRQQLYSMRMNLDSIYTPQMIVDGTGQFIGSDSVKANETITNAAGPRKPEVSIDLNGQTANVSITGFGPHTVATAVLAIAEDGLVTEVSAGNNKGIKLPHISVVRQLKPFGKVPEKATEFSGTVTLPSNPAWNSKNIKYVVFVQEDMSGRIIAVGRAKP